MKVTQVSIGPTNASIEAEHSTLTPELLAAVAARYSRNNEGLAAILEKVDYDNPDKSVEGIFNMLDFGHQSIADMVPVALFIDDISLWLAYYIWTLCPTAGGMESSTRYITMTSNKLIDPIVAGIPVDLIDSWRQHMAKDFEYYEKALDFWTTYAKNNPEVTRIPAAATGLQRARLLRNYAFDRARYWLPAAALTNVSIVMSARGWAQLCQNLRSHPNSEANNLGYCIVEQLKLVAPRMIKYANGSSCVAERLRQDFEELAEWSRRHAFNPEVFNTDSETGLYITDIPCDMDDTLAQDLAHHTSRYVPVGVQIKRMTVCVTWTRVAFAELRDLNRHRTGNKYCPLYPVGFYCAADQLPKTDCLDYYTWAHFGVGQSALAKSYLNARDTSYVYWTLLGTQYFFEHVMQADKFVYEAELRTGPGCHFRYVQHWREALEKWYKLFPSTKGLILEGRAEPE